MIVGNVIDFECAAIDVAQHEIGRTRSVNRRDARELPFQTDRPDEGGVGDVVVADVVDLEARGGRPLKRSPSEVPPALVAPNELGGLVSLRDSLSAAEQH